jgi:predicted SnoaL-like aldol condensation-catalyzing enzyme
MKQNIVRAMSLAILLVGLSLPAPQAFAQDPVMGVEHADALFTDKNKKLHRNKQAAYHIVKDLLEANQWQDAHKYLTQRYIQHNPNAANGLDGVVTFFTKVMGRKPTPVPEKMATKVVSVVAQGDYVIVVFPREFPRPDDPSKKYYTTWFDMWRFVDGKADEHWDPATLPVPAPRAP